MLLDALMSAPESEHSKRNEANRILMVSKQLHPIMASAFWRVKRAGNSESARRAFKAAGLCFLSMATVGLRYAIISCGTQERR